MYSETELAEIRETLSGKRLLDEEGIKKVCERFPKKEDVPEHVLSLIELFPLNPELFNKLTKDKRVERFHVYGFFPGVFELVYGSEISPEISGLR